MNPRPQKGQRTKRLWSQNGGYLRALPRGRGSGKTRERGGTGEMRARLGFFAAYRFARNAGRGNRMGAARGRATGASEGTPEARQTNTQQPPRPRPKRTNGGDRSRTKDKGSATAAKGDARTTPPSTVGSAETTPRAAPFGRHLLKLLSFFVMG